MKDNIFLGQLPKRIVIVMAHNEVFAGTVLRNPYNSEHFDVNCMQFHTDREPVLAKPLKPNIVQGKYFSALETLCKSSNKLNGEKSSIIKREDWHTDYALFSFNLTPDYDGDDHYALITHWNMRLEMNFAKVLQNTVNVTIHVEFDSLIEISSNRNIQFDYQS